MSAEKSKALILKVLPYRESSCILYLFTEEHGLIHGIAKGIRKQKSKQDFLERGFLIELIVYIKPHRDLHTVGSVNVLEFFSAIRSNLIKSALRDAAFETVLLSITGSDVHPELFDFFVKFLQHLQNTPESKAHPFALWLFYHRFSQHMGFGLDLKQCMSCGSAFKEQAFLVMNKGGLECGACCESRQENFSIPVFVLSHLTKGNPKPEKLRQFLTPESTKKITWLFADYCRYHFDIQKEYKALMFLDEMAGW